MKARLLIPLAAVGAVTAAFGFWRYVVTARVAGPDEFLVITSKFGDPKPEGQILAQDGQRGILEKTLGTGRHFINPIFYEVETVRAQVIPPLKVGIVTSKAGKAPASGTVVAERGERGIWREPLGPGKYKLNPYAYKIDVVDMIRIPPGQVGVLINIVTSKVEDRTLPPGLHKINTQLFRVDLVDTGVKHLGYSKKGDDIITEQMLMSDDLPTEVAKMKYPTGGKLGFPSKDGFNVGLDASIVYEVEPKHAVRLIAQFGKTEILTQRIIEPALNSVTRNVGSSVTAKEIIQGETRLEFQQRFTDSFLATLAGEPVKAIDALPRGLYVPPKIQLPIMQSTIKQELKLTNKEIELTTELQNTEEQERKKINLEIERVKSETEFEVSNITSESLKEVSEFEAETASRVASVRLDIAKIEAQTRLLVSQGEAEIITYAGAKSAEMKRARAAALGGIKNLVLLNFVESLPEDIPFNIIHSGEGTLWTDLEGLTKGQAAILKKIQDKAKVEDAD